MAPLTQQAGVSGSSGTTFSVAAGTGLTQDADGLSLSTPVSVANGGTNATTAAGARTSLGAVGKASDTIGDGSATVIQFTHSLNTTLVGIHVYRGGDEVWPLKHVDDANNVTITYTSASKPTTDQDTVVVNRVMSQFLGSRPIFEGNPLSGDVLDDDSRTFADGPTTYPEGESQMYSTDYVTAGTFAITLSSGIVKTNRFYDSIFSAPSAVQTLQGDFEGTNEIFYRQWDPDDEEWSTFRTLSVSNHTHASIVPLIEDIYAESTDIASYPSGISIMPVSAAADWDGNGVPAVVLTYNTGEFPYQLVRWYDEIGGATYAAVRVWYEGFGWLNYDYQISSAELLAYTTTDSPLHQQLVPLTTDRWAETDVVTVYAEGASFMPVTGGANWGPNSGQAGHVVTEHNGSDGKQTFHQYSNTTSYERTYTSGAWGSWRNTKDADTLDGNDSAFFATATSVSDHLGDTTDAHDASAISIADSANQYTATNAEDALAEVLDALQAHEADTAAAHAATAISYAGSTNLSATTVEAGLDELDTEKASTGSVTTVQTNLDNHTGDTTAAHAASAISYAGSTNLAADDVEEALDELDAEKLAASTYTAGDVLSKLLTVDGGGSGLDADLLDGNSSAHFATASSVSDHLADTSDAHDASAISILDSANQYTATDAEGALAEVLDALQAHEADAWVPTPPLLSASPHMAP